MSDIEDIEALRVALVNELRALDERREVLMGLIRGYEALLPKRRILTDRDVAEIRASAGVMWPEEPAR